jgi:hypothetical protein
VACAAGPDVSESGLVLALDGANYKSFKGTPATNVLNQITSNFGNQSSSLFKVTNGSETVLIPSLGYVTSKYMDFYNDYNGGSGNCCPALFTYGTGLAVSPSTTYTYSIIYKTTTGYSHPNYMYRYEYNSGGTYLIEGGVHSEGNRTSLGDGWWFAWGQFTTQATAATLATYLFHYEYATQNRVYVYKAALYAGTYVIPPEHMLNSGEVRGATVATGGGWADMTGRSNNGELVNGPTYSSANGGSLSFDGVDDYIDLNTNDIITGTNPFTFEAFYKVTNTSVNAELFGNYGSGYTSNTIWISGRYGVYINTSVPYFQGYPLGAGTYHMAFTRTSAGACVLYKNGVVDGTATSTTSISVGQNFRIGSDVNGIGEVFGGNLYNLKIYNRALTAQEVQQNYNATRSRFGI